MDSSPKNITHTQKIIWKTVSVFGRFIIIIILYNDRWTNIVLDPAGFHLWTDASKYLLIYELFI